MNFDGRNPGFRFSISDAAVLVAGAVATGFLFAWVGSLCWLLAIVLVHFFLFCNVFRIRRKYELIWAALFVVNVLIQSMRSNVTWQLILLAQLPATFVVIGMEIFSDRYHGIGHRLRRRKGPQCDYKN